MGLLTPTVAKTSWSLLTSLSRKVSNYIVSPDTRPNGGGGSLDEGRIRDTTRGREIATHDRFV